MKGGRCWSPLTTHWPSPVCRAHLGLLSISDYYICSFLEDKLRFNVYCCPSSNQPKGMLSALLSCQLSAVLLLLLVPEFFMFLAVAFFLEGMRATQPNSGLFSSICLGFPLYPFCSFAFIGFFLHSSIRYFLLMICF